MLVPKANGGGKSSNDKIKLIFITLLLFILAILGNFIYQNHKISQERAMYKDTEQKVKDLYARISIDKTLGDLRETGFMSKCVLQNIGKLDKNLVCYSQIRLLFRTALKEDAIKTTFNIERKVAAFSQISTYPTATEVDRDDAWLYVSRPTSKYPDSIKCNFSYEYSKPNNSLMAILNCLGNARKAYI